MRKHAFAGRNTQNLFSAYNCSLISSLTIPVLAKPLETFKDVLNAAPNLDIMTEQDTAMEQLMSTSSNQIFRGKGWHIPLFECCKKFAFTGQNCSFSFLLFLFLIGPIFGGVETGSMYAQYVQGI